MAILTLPRVPTAPRDTRRYLRPRLRALGFSEEATDEVLVAVSEAVTNAVLHGGRERRAPAATGRAFRPEQRPHDRGPGSAAVAGRVFRDGRGALPGRPPAAGAAPAAVLPRDHSPSGPLRGHRPARRTPGSDVITVGLAVDGAYATVAVTSPRTGWTAAPPPAVLPDPSAEGGRGFFIIQSFTDAWRVEQGADGTTVYLSRRLPAPGRARARMRAGRRASKRPRRPGARRPGRRTA